MLKRLLLIALFVVGATVLYAQSSGTSGSSQGTQQDQPGASGQQGTQQDQPGSTSGSGSTTSDQSGSSNTGTSDQSTTNKMVSGTISKIDHSNNTITIKDDTTKETQQFALSASATLTKDGSSITQSDLKKGDRVNVEVDGQNNITKMDVMSKSKSKSKSEEKPH